MSAETYVDPRCGCPDTTGIHLVTCAYWPLYVTPPTDGAE